MRNRVPGQRAPIALINSQFLLIVFSWFNLRKPGFWALATGQMGARPGNDRDIVLPVSASRVWFLADRFILPGDFFIAIGAFWLLWSQGSNQFKPQQVQLSKESLE